MGARWLRLGGVIQSGQRVGGWRLFLRYGTDQRTRARSRKDRPISSLSMAGFTPRQSKTWSPSWISHSLDPTASSWCAISGGGWITRLRSNLGS